ncbi:MAG TPA: TonB-dependent siderophore receptor [Rhodanobacteraceae bacterium]
MKLTHTPLLLALLPIIATAAPTHARPGASSANTDQPVQSTDLPSVQVKAKAAPNPDNTGINAYGAASLHDTPAAVSVLSRQTLSDYHVRNLRELVRHDASLGDDYAAVGYYQNITIRGFPLDYATAYRINNLTVVGEQRVALEDVQSVEILKGLAGIQGGVMEPGGVVDYVTKRPANVRKLTLGTDSHGSRYGALDVGKWLTSDFGVRVNLAWNKVHSWVDHADGRRNFYSVAADWHVTPDATLQIDSNYQANAQRSVSGYQLLGGTTIPQHASNTQMLGFEPWQRPVTIHTSNTSVRFNDALTDNWQLHLAAGHSRSVINDNVAYAYGCAYAPECADDSHPGNFFAPNGDYDIYEYRSPDDTRVANQGRATLAGQFATGGVTHHLSVGVSAFQRTIDRRVEVYDYVGTANISDANPPYFPTTGDEPGPSARRLTDWQHTAFALDRMQLATHWQAVVGGHFVRLHERAYASDGTPERDTRMSRALPQVAVLWQPGAPTTLYASWSKGLSLGEEAPWWASNGDAFLGPRLSRQLETGIKYRASDALDLSAALYRINEPYQYAMPDTSPAGFTFVQHGREVHTGLELAANGQITRDLRLNASVSVIRARATDTGTPAYEGHQVVNVPKLRGALYAQYRLPFAPQWTVLGGWRYVAPNVATPDGKVRVPAYNVFNAGLGYATHWGAHPLTWRLSIHNLFNRFYWRDTGTSGGDSFLFPGTPRLARLTLTIGL